MAKKYEFKPDRPYSGFWGKLLLTKLQRRALLKWCLYALFLLVLSVLQDVLLCRVKLFGTTTELVPCGIFLICMLEGLEQGCIFALAASVLYLFSGTAAGVHSIVLITLLACGVTAFRQSFLQKGFGAAMVCTAAAMVAYELAVFFICLFLGQATFVRIGSFLMTAVLTMLTAPVMYPVLKAIAGGEAWKE